MEKKGDSELTIKMTDIFDEYPNPVYIVRPVIEDGVSEDFEYIYVNKAFSLFLGRSRKELIGHRYRELFHEPGEKDWLNLFMETAKSRKHQYVDNVSTVIGRKMYTETFYIKPDLCGCIIHDFQSVQDAVQKEHDEELHRRANYDYLTGFYNRFYLQEMYDEISGRQKVGIAFLDINNLKLTNDTRGHAAGDELIVSVAGKLRLHYPDSLIFRMGGDEFVIITTGLDENEFTKLSEESRKLFCVDNLAALGYCYYETVDNLKDCIDYCDSLMYRQKRYMKARLHLVSVK
jgi:diguanylate cyclase (GGDEF)-like protein